MSFIQRIIDNPDDEDDRVLIQGITVGPEDVAVDPAHVVDLEDGRSQWGPDDSAFIFPQAWLIEEPGPEPTAFIRLPEGAEWVRWQTWTPLDPAICLNLDIAVAEDARSTTETTEIAYRVPSIEEFKEFDPTRNYRPDNHRVLATVATVLGATDLDSAAEAVRLKPEILVAEAEGWAAAAEIANTHNKKGD